MNIHGICNVAGCVRTEKAFSWKYSPATSLRGYVCPGVSTEIRTQHIRHASPERQGYFNQLGLVYHVTQFGLVDRNGYGVAYRLSLLT